MFNFNLVWSGELAAFFVFAVVAAVTPGPSVVMVMAAAARGGMVGGLGCLAGVVAGMALMMGAANLGLGGFVQAFPWSLMVLKWGGAAFLLWLSWKVASAPPMTAVHDKPPVGFWAALAGWLIVTAVSWVASSFKERT